MPPEVAAPSAPSTATLAAPAAAPAAPAAPTVDRSAEYRAALAQQFPDDKKLAVQAPAPKPKAEQPKPVAKPEEKKGVDCIPALGVADEPVTLTEQPKDGEPTDGEDDPKQQKTWDKYKASHKWREQNEPELTAKAKRAAELEEKIAKEYEPLAKEIEEHRQFRAAFDWENGKEYQEKVAKPMATQWQEAAQVADYLGVDKMKLERAMLEPNPLKRDELIEAVLGESTKEVKPSAITRVCTAASKLAEINAEASRMEAEALDLQNAIKGRKEQETLKEKQEREAQWSKASDEIARAYETKFGPLIAKNPEIAKALREARIAEDPMDQAMQAQSAEMLPVVTQALVEALKENAALKKHRKDVAQAKPTLGGEQTAPPSNGEHRMTHQEAVAAHFGGRR